MRMDQPGNPISDAGLRFIERMGHSFEQDGLTRIAGRIFGQLLLSRSELSQEELAERLQVSRGSVSQETRMLERLGALERVTKPGDRRVYYRAAEDGHDRMLTLRLERFRQTRQMLNEALETEEASDPGVRQRLHGFGDLFAHMEEAIRDTWEWWQQQRGERLSPHRRR
jgi:DNA-binding transcriptional regulator GbsR (MarR family)